MFGGEEDGGSLRGYFGGACGRRKMRTAEKRRILLECEFPGIAVSASTPVVVLKVLEVGSEIGLRRAPATAWLGTS